MVVVRRQHFVGSGWRSVPLAVIMLLLSLVTATAIADDTRSVRFQHLSRDDGLSQSFVYSIVQDHDGYMWFGTQEGLNRFDGYTVTVFSHDPANPGSISDETIRTITVDQRGVLWVGTDAGGLSRFNASDGSFTNYLHDPGDDTTISDNRVRVVYEDPAGYLWVGTDGSGLDRFDSAKGEFEHFAHATSHPDSLAGEHVWDVLRDSRGTLWVATNAGLSRFDDATGTFRHYRDEGGAATSINDDALRVLFEDAEGRLWLGTESGGLNRFDPEDESFTHYLHDELDPLSISANRINTIFQDDGGVLWVGTVAGLNAWRPVDDAFDRYQHNPGARHSLAHDNVMSIFQDRGGILWVGTYDGLSRWNQRNRALLHHQANVGSEAGLSENTVLAFAESGDGNIWVGTYGGLNRLERGSQSFQTFRHDPNDERSISSDRVMALVVDSDGGLWAGTRESGLNYYDPDTGDFRRFVNDPYDPGSLGANGVTSILRDSEGALWVATFDGGLNRLDEDTGKFERFRHDPEDPDTLSSDRPLVLLEDSTGILWVGTYGSGLNSFDRATGKFTRYKSEPGRRDGLPGDNIYMIQEGQDGDLWISVKGRGIVRWPLSEREKGNVSVVRYSEIDGLPSNTVYSGTWDSHGSLWLGTNRGLSRFAPDSGAFKNYDTSHGLQDDEFNFSAALTASDGALFFGGINGFNVFRPDELTNHHPPPPVVIRRFDSHKQAVNLSGDAIELSYGQNVVSFEFAALDFAAPEKNRYAYRLDGIDNSWIDAGNLRKVTYTNLLPGDYTFRVIAANNDGVWNHTGASVSFTRVAAPWRTWWAYSLYVVAIGTFLLVAARTHDKRRRQAAMLAHAEEMDLAKSRLSEAQRIAGVGNWVWHVEKDELWWSEEVYRLFDKDPDTFRPSFSQLLDLVHPDDKAKRKHESGDFSLDGGPFESEYRIVAADGATRVFRERGEVTVDKKGNPTRVAGTILDVTDRKNAEDDIQHRADFQALLADLSSSLMCSLSTEFDEHVNHCLEKVGRRYNIDAISIRWLATEHVYLSSRYSWEREQYKQRKDAVGTMQVPWISAQLLSGRPVVIHDVSAMPKVATEEMRLLQDRGTQSMLGIPLMLNEKLAGSSVYSRIREKQDWSEETISELTLVTGMLATSIARYRASREIEKLNEELQRENVVLKEEVRLAHGFDEIIGEDAVLKRCFSAAEKVAPTNTAVLVLGETGTGKELLATAIHKLSPRHDRPMISVNCPALPANLIESELFGHEKGAFTGAESRRLGRFELANGSTIFLDEVGELPLELQAKLLRVLQSGEFERLGGTETLKTDVRLIAATNRNLPESIERGEFRSDLYYRVGSFPITLPPLRERRGDIPLLAEYFVQKHAKRLNRAIEAISARAMKEMQDYSWPGNIRELESIIERALITANGDSVLELPGPLDRHAGVSTVEAVQDDQHDLIAVERSYIIGVLEETSWKISGEGGAAGRLGIPSSTLRSKMKRLGINRGTS